MTVLRLAGSLVAFVTYGARASTAFADEPPPEGSLRAEDAPPANATIVDEPPKTPESIEVNVDGDRAPPGSASFGRREIREMPGILGDPYRAIEVQPGVTPAASGVPYYFIRGAPPGNVGYFFDGIPVPMLFHVGAGPSIIPPGIVNRVELHLGAFPADLGRLAGAVIEAESTPPRFEWRGEAAFRTVDLGGLIEGPAWDGASVLLGGHYSVGASLLSALVPNIGIDYADYQGRLSTKAGRDGRFTLTTFGSYDYLATTSDVGTDTEFTDVLIDSDFHRVDARYDKELDGGGKLSVGATLGLDQSRGAGVDLAQDFKLSSHVIFQKPLATSVLLRAGFDMTLDGYRIDVSDDPCPEGGCGAGILGGGPGDLEEAFSVLFPSRVDLATGGFVDALIVLDERASITPGIRVDQFTSLGASAVAVDPRLVGRFQVSEAFKLIPAIGVASQLPGFAPIPALQIGGIPGGLQRSLQTSFGAELDVMPVDLRATVFRHLTWNLTDAVGEGRGSGFGKDRFLRRSTGDGYGLELSAKGALSKNMFFLASYTLSRSTREILGRTVPSAYDRTHVGHLAFLYELGRNWKAGVRYVFYTGFPADEAGPDRVPSESPDRTKPFFRLDLRLAKRWIWDGGTYVGLVFDMQNATLTREVFDVQCDEEGCQPREIGPITIPTLAFEAGF